MTEEIYQTIKSMLEEARGDRYPRLARLLGPVEPHLFVNYENGQVKAGEALKLEKERHERITAALEWLEDAKGLLQSKNPLWKQESEVSDATETRIEPSDDLGEHTGDGESGTPAEASSSSSVIEREKESKEN